MWNKTKYEKYQKAVEHNLAHLNFVSTGACPGCEECGLMEEPSEHEREIAEEPHFSWSACESCGSNLGGDRHPAHGCELSGHVIEHFSVCTDCFYYLNYGQLDDTSMMEIEA